MSHHRTVFEALASDQLVPVIALDAAADAVPLGRALLAGGLSCVEITLRTAAALDGIRALAGDPALLVGAGTVLQPDQVDLAVEAGARFVVSPGLDPDVVARCLQRAVDVVPGVATATEVQSALRLGLEVLKLFPAEAMGGIDTVRALAGPFGAVRFVPTGGVDRGNAPVYLAHPSVLAVGGSWMAPKRLIRAGDWDAITTLSREAVAMVRGLGTD